MAKQRSRVKARVKAKRAKLVKMSVTPLPGGRYFAKCVDAEGGSARAVIDNERQLLTWLTDCSGRIHETLQRPRAIASRVYRRG